MAQRQPPRRYHDDTSFTQRGQYPQITRNDGSLTLGRTPRSKHTNFHDPQNRSTGTPPPLVPSRSSSFRTNPGQKPVSSQQYNEERNQNASGNRHANDDDDSEVGSLAERKQRLLQKFPHATLKSVNRIPDRDYNQQTVQGKQELQTKPQPQKSPKPPRPLPSSQSTTSIQYPSGNENTTRHFNSPSGPPTIPRMNSKSRIAQDTRGSSSSESGSSGDGRFVRRKKAVPIPTSDVSRSSLQHLDTRAHNSASVSQSGNSHSASRYPSKSGFENAREMIRESHVASSDHTARRESASRNGSIRRTPSTRSNVSVGGAVAKDTNPNFTSARHSSESVNPDAIHEQNTSRVAIQQCLVMNAQPYIAPQTSDRVESSGASQQAVQLQNFLSTYAHLLPSCVDVRQGLMCQNSSISQNERLYLHFLKLCRVVVMLDLERKHHYYVPINSLQKFGIIYDPHNDIRSYGGYVFQTAGDLMKAKPLPSVVLATSSFNGGSPEKSVEANELLFIRGTSKITGISRARYLKVQTQDFVEKHLSLKCAANFSTKPDAVQMHLSTMIDHYIPLPQKAILYPNSQVKHLLPSSLVLEAVILEKLTSVATVVATVQSSSSMLDIAVDVNIQIEPVALNQSEQEWLNGVSYNTYKYLNTQNPVLVCGNLSSELQDKLYHSQVPSMETKGVQLYLPNVTSLPPELKNALETQCLANDKPTGHVANGYKSSSKNESSSGSEEAESDSSDESDDTIEEEEDEEEQDTQDGDEDGLYETIDDAISALPDEEAQRLKTTAIAGVSSMRSKITNMLKVVTTKRPSASHNESIVPDKNPPDTVSLESDQEEYDNISYHNDAPSIQSRVLPDPQANTTSPPRFTSQQVAGGSTSDRESEKDSYEEYQFGVESGPQANTDPPIAKEKPRRLVPPLFPPKLSQTTQKITVPLHSGGFNQTTQKSMFSMPSQSGSDSYEKLHQLYTRLENQVTKLTEEHQELKSSVNRLLATSSSGKKGREHIQPDMSQSTPQSEEDNRRFLASLSDHQV